MNASRRKILIYPHPTLQEVCEPVESFNLELDNLIKEMTALLEKKKKTGVGLAAPQVGVSKRFFLACINNPDESREFKVFVNPQITAELDPILGVEGCLSLPGVLVGVTRATKITIEAQDQDGNPFTLDLSGFPARIVLHELDHLNGVLITDHAKGIQKGLVEEQLKKLSKRAKK